MPPFEEEKPIGEKRPREEDEDVRSWKLKKKTVSSLGEIDDPGIIKREGETDPAKPSQSLFRKRKMPAGSGTRRKLA